MATEIDPVAGEQVAGQEPQLAPVLLDQLPDGEGFEEPGAPAGGGEPDIQPQHTELPPAAGEELPAGELPPSDDFDFAAFEQQHLGEAPAAPEAPADPYAERFATMERMQGEFLQRIEQRLGGAPAPAQVPGVQPAYAPPAQPQAMPSPLDNPELFQVWLQGEFGRQGAVAQQKITKLEQQLAQSNQGMEPYRQHTLNMDAKQQAMDYVDRDDAQSVKSGVSDFIQTQLQSQRGVDPNAVNVQVTRLRRQAKQADMAGFRRIAAGNPRLAAMLRENRTSLMGANGVPAVPPTGS